MRNCYATFPDGKVRDITVTEDYTGVPIFTVGGIIVGANPDTAPIYAFDNSTGFYHLVTTFIDGAGEPMLSVAEEPSDEGTATYVRDASGFYRRMDCFEDSSGKMALRTGEVQA